MIGGLVVVIVQMGMMPVLGITDSLGLRLILYEFLHLDTMSGSSGVRDQFKTCHDAPFPTHGA